jgi:hypothetical protein
MSQLPDFKSNIPNHLLDELNDKDKYIIEQLSVMSQKSDWLIGENRGQSEKLSTLETSVKEVDTKLKFTNGKIGSALISIKALEDKNASEAGLLNEVKKIVDAKEILTKLLFNKWFWGAFIVFVVGAIKISTNPEILDLFYKILGIS